MESEFYKPTDRQTSRQADGRCTAERERERERERVHPISTNQTTKTTSGLKAHDWVLYMLVQVSEIEKIERRHTDTNTP